MSEINLTVNGVTHRLEIAEGRVTLVDVLRDQLGLTGAKVGCGVGRCGACTVIVNGKAATGCTVLAGKADGAEVLTVEGLTENGRLHPIQEALVESGAVQCGYCTPGIVMRLYALFNEKPSATDVEILEALKFHLCRCTGYEAIIEGARLARSYLEEGGKARPKAPTVSW